MQGEEKGEKMKKIKMSKKAEKKLVDDVWKILTTAYLLAFALALACSIKEKKKRWWERLWRDRARHTPDLDA